MRVLAADFPLDPKRSPIFYGWVVAAVGTIGITASLPGQTVGLAAFTDLISADAGISVRLLSLAYLVGTVGSGLLLPFCGGLFDRFGARATAATAALLFGLALLYMAAVDQTATWLQTSLEATGAPAWLGPFLALTIGFFGIRFLGQGTLTMASRAMMGKWFNVKRGFVMGVSTVVVSLIFPASPPVINWLIQHISWQGMYVGFALVCGFLMAILAVIFFRDNPEECGLLMDNGATGSASQQNNPELVVHKEFTLSEALVTWPFWAVNLATAYGAFFITAFTFHIKEIGLENNLSKQEALNLFLPVSIICLIGSIAVGWLMDRTRLKYLTVLFCLGLSGHAIGTVLLPSVTGYALLFISGGVAASIFQPLTGVVWPRFFGREHLGAISGFNMASLVVGSGLGPYAFIWAAEAYGGYYVPLYGSAILGVLLAVGAFWADNPQRQLAAKV